ncbi:MAG TPA: TetR/AcrR family transcriptional regulator [Rhizomicrobium sp.]|jgi:AcrR family transcriptional regulator|nr:TetR/AcrR family transcriptional regulator [Rhizomicrobium sp.]
MPRVLTATDLADFREKLIAAATEMFAAKGREAFTMREVAAALGVSAMTPYRYFKDKDEILAAVRAHAFNRFADALESAFERPGDVRERSAAVGQAYVNFAFSEPASYRLMFDMAQPDEANYPELVRATERARQTMTDHVRALVLAGALEGDPVLIGHVLWASLHGAVVLKLAGKLGPECDFDRIVSGAFAALWEGFRPGKG